jgi:diguanylate cyclase (GGDEF)-like protein
MVSIAVRRYLLVFALAFVVLIAGIAGIMQVVVERLLYWDATATAESWAKYLVDNVEDIEAIAAGETPSEESMRFFSRAPAMRGVFGFEVFDLKGNLRLASDGNRISLVAGTMKNPTALSAAARNAPVVAVEQGSPPIRPRIYSEAYLVATVEGAPRAIVAAFLDLSEKSDHFRREFMFGAAALCMLTGFAFAFPIGAWYKRTREKQSADDQIVHMAHHDRLTGLYNRARFMQRLQDALVARRVNGRCLALHYIDLDRFKPVNDLLGHAAGDRLLEAVAERIRESIDDGAIAARLGGDEFVVLQPDIADRDEVEALVAGLLAALARPYRLGGHELRTTASIGVALAPEDGDESERLLRSADLALYKAKADGRSRAAFFAPELDRKLQQRLALEQTLSAAVATGAFELAFQPLVRVADAVVHGYEALLRLRGPDGQIPPSLFIPVAEKMGLIGQIGAWVLHQACAIAATWPAHVSVSINLSPAQFGEDSVAGVVKQALADSGLDPCRLQLEITEGLLLHDVDAILDELRCIKDLGVAIVMDDFGIGYSSLSYLWRFPFDKVKIDGSFIQAVETGDASAEKIMRTIVGLGHSLQMKVTVEGVETERQASFARELGCDEVQGYYFGRPGPAAAVAAVASQAVPSPLPAIESRRRRTA